MIDLSIMSNHSSGAEHSQESRFVLTERLVILRN
jgi:hypothetical protein